MLVPRNSSSHSLMQRIWRWVVNLPERSSGRLDGLRSYQVLAFAMSSLFRSSERVIQGHASKKARRLENPKRCCLSRRQKRAMEGEDMRNNPHGMKNHSIVSHAARLPAQKPCVQRRYRNGTLINQLATSFSGREEPLFYNTHYYHRMTTRKEGVKIV